MPRGNPQYVIGLFAALAVWTGSNGGAADQLKPYAPTPQTAHSPVFAVRAKAPGATAWQSVPVDFLFSVHCAQLAAAGTLTLQVSVPERIESCSISPKNQRADARRSPLGLQLTVGRSVTGPRER